MNWEELPLYVIDFEGSLSSGVVEYGVVVLRAGGVQETYTKLCSPLEAITPTEFQQHGISSEDVKGKAPFTSEQEQFMSWREQGAFVAHHAIIESGLIRKVWPFGRTFPDFLDTSKNTNEWGPWVDTYRLYQRCFPGLESYKLSALIDVFDLSEELGQLVAKHCPSKRSRYHCALYDALASAVLLMHLSKFEGFAGLSIEWLLTMSASSAIQQEEFRQGELFPE